MIGLRLEFDPVLGILYTRDTGVGPISVSMSTFSISSSTTGVLNAYFLDILLSSLATVTAALLCWILFQPDAKKSLCVTERIPSNDPGASFCLRSSSPAAESMPCHFLDTNGTPLELL